jgi:hypothetical protein
MVTSLRKKLDAFQLNLKAIKTSLLVLLLQGANAGQGLLGCARQWLFS